MMHRDALHVFKPIERRERQIERAAKGEKIVRQKYNPDEEEDKKYLQDIPQFICYNFKIRGSVMMHFRHVRRPAYS